MKNLLSNDKEESSKIEDNQTFTINQARNFTRKGDKFKNGIVESLILRERILMVEG